MHYESIDYYQKAAKLDPKDDRVYYGIAAAQFVLGQLKAAEENCQIALKLNPGNKMRRRFGGDMKKK
jgi:tetratricopeptide (TPR) repeat protein